jgi:RasGEF domain
MTAAIFAGLTSLPVARLYQSWAELRCPTSIAMFLTIQKFLAVAENPTEYRTMVKCLVPPCLPDIRRPLYRRQPTVTHSHSQAYTSQQFGRSTKRCAITLTRMATLSTFGSGTSWRLLSQRSRTCSGNLTISYPSNRFALSFSGRSTRRIPWAGSLIGVYSESQT